MKDNLEIWSDLERTYVELEDIRHLQRIKYHHNVRQVMQGIKKTWKRAAERPRAREAAEEGIGDVRFHYLICRDRISRKAPEATKE